jgi:hypothetical protein
MPYRLRKAPGRELYWVVSEDGRHLSKDPMPIEKAKKQLTAVMLVYLREKGRIPGRKDLKK